MRTEIAARVIIQYKADYSVANARQRAYPHLLIIDDDDYEHGHDGGGHSFPATREQLVALKWQIEEVLRATES